MGQSLHEASTTSGTAVCAVSFFGEAQEEFDRRLAAEACQEDEHSGQVGHGRHFGETIFGHHETVSQIGFVKQSQVWQIFCSAAESALQHLFTGLEPRGFKRLTWAERKRVDWGNTMTDFLPGLQQQNGLLAYRENPQDLKTVRSGEHTGQRPARCGNGPSMRRCVSIQEPLLWLFIIWILAQSI